MKEKDLERMLENKDVSSRIKYSRREHSNQERKIGMAYATMFFFASATIAALAALYILLERNEKPTQVERQSYVTIDYVLPS